MKKIIFAAMAFSPVMAMAQSSINGNLSGIENLVRAGIRILNLLVPAAFALAILFFFFGIAKYILAAGDPKAAEAGKSIMIYGVVAIAVMASVFGIVKWLQTSLGVESGASTGNILLPTITNPNK